MVTRGIPGALLSLEMEAIAGFPGRSGAQGIPVEEEPKKQQVVQIGGFRLGFGSGSSSASAILDAEWMLSAWLIILVPDAGVEAARRRRFC